MRLKPSLRFDAAALGAIDAPLPRSSRCRDQTHLRDEERWGLAQTIQAKAGFQATDDLRPVLARTRSWGQVVMGKSKS